MATPRPIPEHLRTVTPRIVVSDGAAAIDFYAQAFGATEVGERFLEPGGRVVHAEVKIGDSVVMISEQGAESETLTRPPTEGSRLVTAIMATYWEDVDAVWERAVGAGAEVIFPLADQFYGERGGRLRDPFGQQWMLSQRTEDLSPAELERRAAAFFAESE
jgi:PhnB protein